MTMLYRKLQSSSHRNLQTTVEYIDPVIAATETGDHDRYNVSTFLFWNSSSISVIVGILSVK